MKAIIKRIGTINERGQPVNFEFDCMNVVPGVRICNDGVILWGGYTVEELKIMIKEKGDSHETIQ